MNTAAKTWLFDLGNSRLKGAGLQAGATRTPMFAFDLAQADAMAALLRQLAPVGPGDSAWLASVATPERSAALTDALQAAGISVHAVRSQAQCAGLRVAYPQPAQLGVDRFLALLAASERQDGPWLLVSAGSALTVDLLADDGRHVGGLIAPMPRPMAQVLAQQFPQLDLPAGQAVDFANNTADAIASGSRAAALGLVERALRQALQLLGTVPTVLLSGGAADLFQGLQHTRVLRLESAVLDGLALYVREQGR
jgi:type III pantothenate kinase